MNAIVQFRKCTLTDDELMELIDKKTDNIFIDGKIPSRNIPAKPNDDYDLLVGELILRFKENAVKAENYDELDNKIGAMYSASEDEGNGTDLADIGELAANWFGYL